MNKVFILLLLLLVNVVVKSQKTDSLTFSPINIDLKSADSSILSPRKKQNHSAPGHYELVAVMDKSQIDRGDSAIIKVFVTGYGQIEQSKMVISCSSDEILDSSFGTHSLGLDKENQFIWGIVRFDFAVLPEIIQMNGGFGFMIKDTRIHLGNYMDANDDPSSTFIITEQTFKNPPYTIHLHFKKSARPDDYKINLHYTYFNGTEWAGSEYTLDFRINSWVQQHETLLQIIAASAALIAFIPLFSSSLKFWRIQFGRFFKYMNSKGK